MKYLLLFLLVTNVRGQINRDSIYLEDTNKYFFVEYPNAKFKVFRKDYYLIDKVKLNEVIYLFEDDRNHLLIAKWYKENDTINYELYWQNSSLASVSKIDSLGLLFSTKCYDSNKNILYSEIVINKKLFCTDYYSTGMKRKSYFIPGPSNYIEWFQGGNVKCIGESYNNGVKNGKWEYFNEQGELLKIKYFKDNELLRD